MRVRFKLIAAVDMRCLQRALVREFSRNQCEYERRCFGCRNESLTAKIRLGAKNGCPDFAQVFVTEIKKSMNRAQLLRA